MRARKLVSADISRHLILKDLAQCAGTNECTLKKAFKYLFDTTIYQYLLSERMKLASQLLLTTRMAENHIAYSCGFASLAGFINTFRRLYGTSPGMYRRNTSNKLIKRMIQ